MIQGHNNMTVQIKRFVEMCEMVAMRFECVSCEATLSLSFAKEIDVKRLLVCPNCERPWIRLPSGGTAELTIQECVKKIRELNNFINTDPPKGFRLSIEVKRLPDEKE